MIGWARFALPYSLMCLNNVAACGYRVEKIKIRLFSNDSLKS